MEGSLYADYLPYFKADISMLLKNFTCFSICASYELKYKATEKEVFVLLCRLENEMNKDNKWIFGKVTKLKSFARTK